MLTRALARPVVCVAACLVLASGCADQPSPRKADATPTGVRSNASAQTTPTTPAVTEATTEAEPTEGASAAAGGSGSLRSRLLGAGEVPGFSSEFRWVLGATRTAEPSTPFGTCQRFNMTSIGAERVVVRRYRPATGGAGADKDRAGELLAVFPDAQTARRAFSVLTSWRARCADRLSRHRTSDVGALDSVSVPGGSAGWYLLTYGPVTSDPDAQFFDAQFFDAQGMARVGSRIAMVSMVLAGQDYDYDAGQEPMAAALQRAARKLS